MGQTALLPDVAEVKLESLKVVDSSIILMVLVTVREHAFCPRCETPSRRVHSRYPRKLSDLPWNGVPVHVRLRSRRFFCTAEHCGQHIFTEPLPNTTKRYARRTRRLSQALDWFALALGGAAGARLAAKLGIIASGSTLLRHVRKKVVSAPASSPRVLGIDDWAWRKGHRYGTILCDLEKRKVIDLLPGRDGESVERWLHAHPGIEVLSRDRASIYADAAQNAAPQAVQVADRWHLLRNLSQALTDVLQPHHRLLTEVARITRAELVSPESHSMACPAEPAVATRAEHSKQQNRERRLERYESVMELARQGMAKKKIARALGIDHRTVRHWTRADGFPERQSAHRRTALDSHAAYLDQRHQQDCHNATLLWRELHAQGFRGHVSAVRRWLRLRYGPRPCNRGQPRAHPAARFSPRHITWLLILQPESAQPFLQELFRQSPQIASCAQVACEFTRMIRQRDAAAWPQWLLAAKTTLLARFATQLQRDEAAVLAALQLHWSNGPVEGHIHRLKLIKRQMYGRAKFDLLRLRVLNAV